MSVQRIIQSRAGFIPAKTINEMKANQYLILGDYVGVAENYTFYKIVNSQGSNIALDNGLYAERVANTQIEDAISSINTKLDEKLNKNDNETLTGNFTVTGSFVSNGEVTAYSDRRLKTNIEKIENALEKVNQINGYTFTMLGTGKRQAGVIAQELEKVLPEVVVQNKNGYLTVMYGHIVALLIEATKELDKEVKELKGGKV